MNDKIKELLGELAEPVMAKLGSVELGIANDGSLVPAEKFDTLKTERNKAQADVATLTAQVEGNAKIVEELTQKAGMSDELKTELTNMTTTMETEKAKVLSEAAEKEANIIKTYAIKEHLTQANAIKEAVGYLVNEFDLASIEMDGDKIKNWDTLLDPVLKNKAPLFGKTKYTGHDPHKGGGAPEANTWQSKYNNAPTSKEKIKIKQSAFNEGVNVG